MKKSVTQDARREENAKKMVGKVGERKGRPCVLGGWSGYECHPLLEIDRVPFAWWPDYACQGMRGTGRVTLVG